jgi:hypothetical protein
MNASLYLGTRFAPHVQQEMCRLGALEAATKAHLAAQIVRWRAHVTNMEAHMTWLTNFAASAVHAHAVDN